MSDKMSKPEHKIDISPKLVLSVLVTLAVLLLIVQNRDDVTITWLAFDITAKRWVILLTTLLAGMVVGELLRIVIRRDRN
jgi:uncharacterized integral membrane protein